MQPFSATGTAGGSNGGAAAAVSARVASFAIAVDMIGDVRVPAALCGKSTRSVDGIML